MNYLTFIKNHREWLYGIVLVLVVAGWFRGCNAYLEKRDRTAFEKGQAEASTQRDQWQQEAEAHRARADQLAGENQQLAQESRDLKAQIVNDKSSIERLANDEQNVRKSFAGERAAAVALPDAELRCRLCAEFKADGIELPSYCKRCH
jgi:septal ring factor EnvC (AmiA/AmiB activator)